jgi:pimeloyl-ACP methyl ester carboxylesterase
MFQRRFALAAIALFAVFAAVILGAGEVLSRPAPRLIGAPPPDFPAQIVRLETGPGQFVAGWFLRGQPARGAVLLLHGVRSNRTQMLGRARFLAQAGYTTLLLDLPAHGESSGERITLGANEAAGAAAGVDFLRHQLPGERIGVVGVSLGAASAVLANTRPALSAVVLESMYPTIEEAVANRLAMRLTSVGAKLAPLLLWQLPLRVGVSADELRPIQKIAALGSPLLVASGAEDRHTTWAETLRLYEAAAQPKELWRVEGAAHVDLHAYQPAEYQRRVLRFFAKHLRDEGPSCSAQSGCDEG